MSETKFKKGEWNVKRDGLSVVTVDTGFGICEMTMAEDVDKHNAVLIAAAPEMYEALKAQARLMHKMGFVEERDLIDALLAKARGEK